VDAVAALQFDHAVDSLTICGHSLGGALATLLAFDVAANPIFKNPTIYTYASPRTGGRAICTYLQPGSPEYLSYRHRVDMVSKLPLPSL
jgi:predicted lipase